MDGYPLVLLGVTLLAVAYSIQKIQGKMKELTNAIDLGFKSIEDGITNNVKGAIVQATSSVDQYYTTLEKSIVVKVLGTSGTEGILDRGLSVMDFASDICVEVGDDIAQGKRFLAKDIRGTTAKMETVLRDTATPLSDAGGFFKIIGDGINIPLPGEPLKPLAKPFYDIGATCTSIGKNCTDAKHDLEDADRKIIDAEVYLGQLSTKVKGYGPQITKMRDEVNTLITDGINDSMRDVKSVTDSVKLIFSSVSTGADNVVKNMRSANAALDQEINGIFRRQHVAALVTAGVALIAGGAAVGL
ncbi:MAG: hypothetical protein SA339_04080 [Methanomassiliicoccus sp.]|nr:hypothetical protein [Methanomassiliicoccus sp.]